jgi:hypothetical protein
MLRDEQLHARTEGEQIWPAITREAPAAQPVQAQIDDLGPFRSAAGTPDVPKSLWALMFGCYISLIGALAIATAGQGQSKFMIVLAASFVVVLFGVPGILLTLEPKISNRPSMDRFLAQGIDTFTGHCGGGAALVQMLVVPVLLILGVLTIAIEIALLL